MMTPKQSLNKAFLKLPPDRAEIDTFKSNLKTLLNYIDQNRDANEFEENLKNHIRDFLRDTYYRTLHEINTFGVIDLVIHNGSQNTTPIGVVLEVKRPANTNEMITLGDLNKKALHEMILYYMRERITNHNLEIKHLLATNGYKWFIFDATEFEKAFVKNREFLNRFNQFEQGQLVNTTTDFFYQEIAHPFLEANNLELKFTYFDLEEYRNQIFSDTNANDKDLVPLFKIFSPTHLLKKPFLTDSNNLDKGFYTELLHIIGLEEVKDGSKKVIKRKKVPNSASLLENTISQLIALDKIRRLPNPSQYGETDEERLFSVGIELVLTWVNRILFLKLLEAQQIKYHNGNQDFAYLNNAKINGCYALNTLFFKVLSRKVSERDPSLEIFSNVPYLNSSLFELTYLEDKCFTISEINNGNLPILPNTVLRDINGIRRTGELGVLNYFFEFLNSYNFSSEGSEEIQEQKKTLINASVLGLIFEKINGYKEGSFYTPGYITTYMCKETIRRAVLQKFKEVKGYDCSNIYPDLSNRIEFTTEGLVEANSIVNSLKICDPAVGSGHFLVSALNEIIAIKKELGILVDRNGARIRDYSITVENDELSISHNESDTLFEYNPINPESKKIQEALFHEKRTIIENCLFGVDINPNSAKLCRLRLWIELLKNAYYTNIQPNVDSTRWELQTLPNIDINIKTGNSLVSKYPLDMDMRPVLQRRNWSINQYKNSIHSYQNARNKEEKRDLETMIHDMKSEFITSLDDSHPDEVALRRVKSELNQLPLPGLGTPADETKREKLSKNKTKLELKLKEIRENKIYENSFEWRFEFPEVLDENGDFKGFDVVIGNPPYVYNRDLEEEIRNFYSNNYKVSDDLYSIFIIQGLSLLREDYFISMITPNTYLTLSTKEELRRILLSNQNVKFSYTGFCFDDAYVETIIFLNRKNESNTDSSIEFIPLLNKEKMEDLISIEKNVYTENSYYRIFFPTTLNRNINSKVHSKILELVKKYKNKLHGKKLKVSESIGLNNYLNQLNSNSITLLGLISDGNQGLITGNNSKYIAQIVTSEEQDREISNIFLNILNTGLNLNISYEEFNLNRNIYYDMAENLKVTLKNLTFFGKFFNYRTVYINNVIKFIDLNEIEQRNGCENEVFIFYNKGNSEGYRWIIPFTESIRWKNKIVQELREGVKTNSRWQGEEYFYNSGFGWVDYFTYKINAFYLEEGVYSKNVVKMHSNTLKISDKIIVCLLNSKFISYYIKTFITSTHTLQINDGRLIPIIIPAEDKKTQLENLFNSIISDKYDNPNKDTSSYEEEIDKIVYQLYGLSEEEIQAIEKMN
jgi:adenine-specific DNA-methyltransferase